MFPPHNWIRGPERPLHAVVPEAFWKGRSKPKVAPTKLRRVMHSRPRCSRYIALAKTHLQHVLAAAAMILTVTPFDKVSLVSMSMLSSALPSCIGPIRAGAPQSASYSDLDLPADRLLHHSSKYGD